MTRILVVCLGNICRSPTAHAVLREKARARGAEVEVDSAGTGDWHIGDPPHPPMIRAAEARGIAMSDLRARQITRADFEVFDLILAMDAQNMADIEAIRPVGNDTPVRLFLDYGPDGGNMPDPYYTGEYDRVIELVEAASEALLDQLQ